MKRFARTTALAAAVSALLLLSACGRHDDNATPATAPAATQAAPATSVPVTPAPASSAPAAAGTAAVPATGSSTAAAAPAALDHGFRIDRVQLGDAVTAAHKVSKAKSVFAPAVKAIYASVATLGSTPGATLSARWSYLEGSGQQVTTISQTIATDGPATTTFRVLNPNDWPQGKYKVEIAVDGKPVTSETFEVKA